MLNNHDLEKYRMESRMENIKIAHRLAEARGNQSYIATEPIEVKAGKDVIQRYGKPVSVNGTFNVFIRRASLRVSEGSRGIRCCISILRQINRKCIAKIMERQYQRISWKSLC